MPRPDVDINAWRHPSLLRIVPETDRGERWCWEHINADPTFGAYQAEHRYGPDILKAAHDAGLVVALDGKIADAPREFPCCPGCPAGHGCSRSGACFMQSTPEGWS